tara:strand:+ start:1998 stop:2300 length:303 start_codon:yes stop_codon:yes gene_type:complete
MAYEPPLKIAIPTPSEIPQGFGPNSTGRKGGNLRIRCTDKEYNAIAYEASKLNLSLAMFCRWCSVQVAQKLKEHRDMESTAISIGETDDSIKENGVRRGA